MLPQSQPASKIYFKYQVSYWSPILGKGYVFCHVRKFCILHKRPKTDIFDFFFSFKLNLRKSFNWNGLQDKTLFMTRTLIVCMCFGTVSQYGELLPKIVCETKTFFAVIISRQFGFFKSGVRYHKKWHRMSCVAHALIC